MAVVAVVTCWIHKCKESAHRSTTEVELYYSIACPPPFVHVSMDIYHVFQDFPSLCIICVELAHFKSYVEKALQLFIFCKKCSNNLI